MTLLLKKSKGLWGSEMETQNTREPSKAAELAYMAREESLQTFGQTFAYPYQSVIKAIQQALDAEWDAAMEEAAVYTAGYHLIQETIRALKRGKK